VTENPLKLKTDDYRITPAANVDLSAIPTAYDGPITRDAAEREFKALRKRLSKLQESLYAEGKRSLLVVFQAMDAAGKDSTVRKVIGPLNPAGVRVTSFKAPSAEELEHDFLWRIHQHAPRHGYIGVFNRSHYEDVLIVRVKNLVPKRVWSKRYDHINAFEQCLADEGTVIRKFFLHISKGYQKQRLQRRLDRSDKHWKFNVGDLAERARWDDYQAAYADALTRCSTPAAPWYVVPAERRWFRNLLVARVLVETLEAMDPKPPKPDFDPDTVTIE